jgi:hypothetical protein
MPDQHYVLKMVEDVHSTVQSLDRLLRGHNGTDGVLTKLSLVKHMTDENRERIDAGLEAMRADVLGLKNDVAMVRSRGTESGRDRTKWEAIGQWASPFGIVLALLLSLLNTMGWIGP